MPFYRDLSRNTKEGRRTLEKPLELRKNLSEQIPAVYGVHHGIRKDEGRLAKVREEREIFLSKLLENPSDVGPPAYVGGAEDRFFRCLIEKQAGPLMSDVKSYTIPFARDIT